MDWINPDAEFTNHDLSTFCYLGQGDEAHQALVIWKTDDDEVLQLPLNLLLITMKIRR